MVQHVGFGESLTPSAFNVMALRDGLIHLRRVSFPVSELTLDQLSVFGEVELAERLSRGAAVVLRPEPEMLIYLSASQGHGEVAVAGTGRDPVDRVAADLVTALSDPEPEEDQVPVTFWAQTPSGVPVNPRRRVHAPSWAEVRDNYAGATRRQLDELMAAREPGNGGLLLWHGEPGTGKSHALRALAREWRGWCDTHFITDADAFLGGQTNYLLSAVLRPERESGRDQRWRLIVLEDAGELLAADARAVAGQALSRLLNLTDGLLGAGMRVIVLVTTNEPLRRMHPAVVRPGRTWAEIEFAPLSRAQANVWLEAQGAIGRVEHDPTLAELFAVAAGAARSRPRVIGFASS